MALTVAELGAALRLNTDPTSPPAEPLLGILHRQLRAAENQVNRYAPDAPEENRDEAVIRTVGYYFERPDSTNPFVLSGARSLLADWHVLVTAKVEHEAITAAAAAIDALAEAVLVPSHPVHVGTHNRYIGWSDGQTIDQAELDSGASFATDRLIVPARATNGYIFAGFPADIGAPDSAVLDGNPTNVIGGWIEQTLRLHRDDEDVVVLVTDALVSPALVGRIWTFGYSP